MTTVIWLGDDTAQTIVGGAEDDLFLQQFGGSQIDLFSGGSGFDEARLPGQISQYTMMPGPGLFTIWTLNASGQQTWVDGDVELTTFTNGGIPFPVEGTTINALDYVGPPVVVNMGQNTGIRIGFSNPPSPGTLNPPVSIVGTAGVAQTVTTLNMPNLFQGPSDVESQINERGSARSILGEDTSTFSDMSGSRSVVAVNHHASAPLVTVNGGIGGVMADDGQGDRHFGGRESDFTDLNGSVSHGTVVNVNIYNDRGNVIYVHDENTTIGRMDTSTTLSAFATAALARARLGYEPDPTIDPDQIGEQVDEVVSTVTRTLEDFIENLTLDGAADIDGTGNDGNNVLTGNDGDNVLITGEGELDELAGGAGSDTYVVNKTTGATTITDTTDDADTLDLSDFVGSGSLSFSRFGTDTLRITNGIGGTVDVVDFFKAGGNGRTIHFIDTGAGVADVSKVTSVQAAAEAVASAGSLGSFIDPDDSLYDNDAQATGGDIVSAAELQVFRTYLGGLGRDPDQGGYDFWLNEITSGSRTLEQLAAGFVGSAEFQALADANSDGDVSTAEFINHMYQNVFGREPDPEGLEFWTDALESGQSQASALVGFTQSNEYAEQTLTQAIDFLI